MPIPKAARRLIDIASTRRTGAGRAHPRRVDEAMPRLGLNGRDAERSNCASRSGGMVSTRPQAAKVGQQWQKQQRD